MQRLQYALPEKVEKYTIPNYPIRKYQKLQVSSGKLLRLNRSIKWISVIPITANPRSTSAISIRLLWGNVLDKCMLFRI